MYRNYGKLFVPRYTFLYFMPVSSKCWKQLLIKRLLEKKKKETFNSASTVNQKNIW